MSGGLVEPLREARRTVRRWIGHGRFYLSLRAGDGFVVTYPKSGTTWVSYFLASILADRTRGERRRIGVPETSDWVPSATKAWAEGQPLADPPEGCDRRIYTFHTGYRRVLPRVVYVVRDPRAVLCSYHRYYAQENDDFDQGMAEFVEANDPWPGDWAEYVAPWIRAARESDRVLLVRYEDLKGNPHEEFDRIARFFGLTLTEAELRDYVERASLESMAETEPNREEKEHPFIRKGEVDSWREEMPGTSVELIERRYSSLMRELGYSLTRHAGT